MEWEAHLPRLPLLPSQLSRKKMRKSRYLLPFSEPPSFFFPLAHARTHGISGTIYSRERGTSSELIRPFGTNRRSEWPASRGKKSLRSLRKRRTELALAKLGKYMAVGAWRGEGIIGAAYSRFVDKTGQDRTGLAVPYDGGSTEAPLPARCHQPHHS